MWNEYGSDNVHFVFGATATNDWDYLNTSYWRNYFTPPLSYWLSIDSELGSFYGMFGDGYVPYNVIIGPGYQIYQAGSGFDEAAARSAIASAMANTDFYLTNPIEDQVLNTGTENIISLTDVFFNATGSDIVFTVSENTDSTLFATAVNGNQLAVNVGSSMGEAKIVIKGQTGEKTGYFAINLKAVNPSLYETLYQGFDGAWLPDGWTMKTGVTGAGWLQSSDESHSGTFSASHSFNNGTQNDWIFTPKMLITPNSMLTFWQKGLYSDYYYSHDIAYSTDLTGSKVTMIYNNLPAPSDWQQVYIDLNYLAGKEIYIGFNYQGDDADSWFVDDVRIWTATGIENISVPDEVVLNQNYPNPFNPVTELSFTLDKEMQISLTVYNSKGQSVAEIFGGKLSAGQHKYEFNAQGLNSGVYFYKLEYENGSSINKMLLLK